MANNMMSRALACLMLVATAVLTPSIAGCAATETRRSAGESVDDAVITARVKTNLVQDERLEAFEIDVDTYRGVVQLNGFVDSPENAERAEEVAEVVPGVVSVRNNLEVKPKG